MVLIFLLLSLLTLSIIIRYPSVSHEMRVDSLFVHGLAESISKYGYARWTIHPLSYFGLYPYSYPSGVPFMLSEISLITGLNGEASVLLISFICGILCALFMFVLVKQVTGDWRAGLAGGMFYTIAPIVLSLSTWSSSTRNFYLVFIPLVIWAFIKFHNARKEHRNPIPYLISVVLLSIVFLSIHRLAIFLVPVLIAYFIAVFLEKVPFADILKISLKRRKLTKYVIGTLLLLLFIGIVLVQYTDLIEIYKKTRWEMRQLYPPEESLFEFLYNIVKIYGQGIGLGILLLPVGLMAILYQTKKKFHDIFLISCFFASTLILIVPIYAIEWITPFACFFISVGFIKLISRVWNKSKKIATLVVVVIVISSSVSSQLIFNYWTSRSKATTTYTITDESTYSSIIYAKYLNAGGFVATRSDISNKFTGYGMPCIPYYDPVVLVYGIVDGDKIEIIPLPIESLFRGVLLLYGAKASIYEKPEWSWIYSMRLYPDSPISKEIMIKYNIEYVIEDTSIYEQWLRGGDLSASILLQQTHLTKYKIYDAENIIIWRI